MVNKWKRRCDSINCVYALYHLVQNLTSRIAYEKPADPLQFILDEMEKIKKGQKLDELK